METNNKPTLQAIKMKQEQELILNEQIMNLLDTKTQLMKEIYQVEVDLEFIGYTSDPLSSKELFDELNKAGLSLVPTGEMVSLEEDRIMLSIANSKILKLKEMLKLKKTKKLKK